MPSEKQVSQLPKFVGVVLKSQDAFFDVFALSITVVKSSYSNETTWQQFDARYAKESNV
jgi:hypothetical protein